GREVEGRELARNRLGDLTAAVTGVDAPESRDPVQNLPALGREVMHAACSGEHAGLCLELAIRREGHPERVECVAGEGIGDGHEVARSSGWGGREPLIIRKCRTLRQTGGSFA